MRERGCLVAAGDSLSGEKGALHRTPKAGGPIVDLFVGERPGGVAVDERAVYFTTLETGRVMMHAK